MTGGQSEGLGSVSRERAAGAGGAAGAMQRPPPEVALPRLLRDDEERLIRARRKRSGLPEEGALIGLALSGGGIRSATFSLGLLQAALNVAGPTVTVCPTSGRCARSASAAACRSSAAARRRRPR